MFFNNLINIFLVYIGVPHRFRINRQHRTLCATVQTPGSIDPNLALTGKTQRLAALLGVVTQFLCSKTLAAVAAISTQIGTEKNVILVIGHDLQHYLRFKSTEKRPQVALTKSCYLNRMSARNQSFIDQCIAQADQAVRTVFGTPTGSGRENPAQPVIEGELTATDKADSIRLMRVNHAGEVCAQALYQGQALTARNRETRSKMTQAAIEENDHLAWCRQRIHELGGHTSLLNPVWFTGSLAIGAASGMLGDKWSLGFLAETEAQVVKHLEGHLQRLPEADNKSHAILAQMKTDEAKHQATAVKAGGINLPKPAKKMMALMSKIMTIAAYRV